MLGKSSGKISRMGKTIGKRRILLKISKMSTTNEGSKLISAKVEPTARTKNCISL